MMNIRSLARGCFSITLFAALSIAGLSREPQQVGPGKAVIQQKSVSADTINMTSAGGQSVVKLGSATNYKLEVNDKWITTEIKESAGSSQVTITVENNVVNRVRIGTVKVISAGVLLKKITVIQKAGHGE
jgi:hypothetical protein